MRNLVISREIETIRTSNNGTALLSIIFEQGLKVFLLPVALFFL